MGSTRTFQRSFAGGEMAPALLGHVGDTKFQSGAARLRNFYTTPQGVAVRRPGFSYVAETKHSGSKASVLVPFRYSNTDALMIEMGEGYFRFHKDGAPIKYLPSSRSIASINTTTDRLTFATPHGFVADQAVRMIRPGGSTAPTGVTLTTTYYIRFIDSYTVELATTAAPNSTLALSGTPSYPLYLASADEVPDEYVASVSIVSVSGTNRLNLGAHDFQTNDPIQFTIAAGGSLPTPLEEGLRYYATRYDANNINVSETEGGPFLTLSAPVLNATVHYAYLSGDLVNYSGAGCYHCISNGPLSNAPGSAYWHLMPPTGELELANSYAEADLATIQYAQSNDVIKFAHEDYDLIELSRYSELRWTYLLVDSFAPNVDTSEISVAALYRGEFHKMKTYSINSGGVAPSIALRGPATYGNQYATLPLSTGDVVFLAGDSSGVSPVGGVTPGIFIVEFRNSNLEGYLFRPIAGGDPITFNAATDGATGYVWLTSSSADRNNYYKVSAIDQNGVESAPSDEYEAVNDLLPPGTRNVITYSESADAVRYRVYKKKLGLFGYIGETEETSFSDENIGPDMSITPLYLDTSLDGDTNPSALAYFEQRLCLANGQTIWMTRSNTELELTYHIPVVDTDRIKFTLQARDVAVIQHIVPLDNLIILTDSTEFVVTPVNSDAITPTSFRARAVSYVGANTVRPVVVNNSLVFCAARGGHVHVFGRSEGGYATGDVSLRAAHLFDGLSVVSMAQQKAPHSIVWCVSSDGTLLGLTYVPEEGVAGWHWDDTEGTFESVAVIPEGSEDRLYAIVKRTIDGSEVRFVERLGSLASQELVDSCYVDSGSTYDGRNTTATTITATTGTVWTAGASITLTASSPVFLTDGPSSGERIDITDAAGTVCKFTLTSVTSETVAVGTPDITVPSGIRSTATTNWASARTVITGLDHLEGETVDILADGAIQYAQEVTSGAVTLSTAATVVHAGLPYTSELKTLPVAFQIDGAFGQGRTKGVNRLWLRVIDSCRFEVGPSEDDMATTNDIAADTLVDSQEIDVNIPSDWTDGGQVWVRQTDPVPLSVVSVVAEVSVGS